MGFDAVRRYRVFVMARPELVFHISGHLVGYQDVAPVKVSVFELTIVLSDSETPADLQQTA